MPFEKTTEGEPCRFALFERACAASDYHLPTVPVEGSLLGLTVVAFRSVGYFQKGNTVLLRNPDPVFHGAGFLLSYANFEARHAR